MKIGKFIKEFSRNLLFVLLAVVIIFGISTLITAIILGTMWLVVELKIIGIIISSILLILVVALYTTIKEFDFS